MYSQQQLYHIWLHSIPGMNARVFHTLTRIASAEQLIKEPDSHIAAVMNAAMYQAFLRCRAHEHIEAFIDSLAKKNIAAVCCFDDDYPTALNERLELPPPVLYIRGRRDIGAVNCATIVGTRHCSNEGRSTASRFARDIASSGVCVVSGLAVGIDAAAHRGALEAHGRTTAILGCGVDVPYPADNQRLVAEILNSGGSLVSEFLPGTPASRVAFPIRNRVLAALSDAVIIVEAPARSGALNTAGHAADMGVNVYAVPGSIYNPNCVGSNELLVAGAFPLVDSRTLLEMQRWQQLASAPTPAPATMQSALSANEALVVSALKSGPLSFDLLTDSTGLNAALLNPLLTTLELRGIIEQSPNKLYVLKHV